MAFILFFSLFLFSLKPSLAIEASSSANDVQSIREVVQQKVKEKLNIITTPSSKPINIKPKPIGKGATPSKLNKTAITIKPAAMAKLGTSGTLLSSVKAAKIPVLAPDMTSAAIMIETRAANQPKLRHMALASASRVSFCMPAKGASALR